MIAWFGQTLAAHTAVNHHGRPVCAARRLRHARREGVRRQTILDRLDVHTAGGIKDVLDAIHAIGPPILPLSSTTQQREPDWPRLATEPAGT